MKLKHFLLTALTLFAGASGVYAGRHYVGFSSVPASYTQHSNGALASVLTTTASGGDTVFVAVGLYVAANAEFRVPANVTLIGGYAKGDVGATTRQYPGQFVPFGSSVVDTTKFTILDGNSYKSTVPANKHRVVKVELNGVVDGCLIRNGHIRNGNGGGVLLDGGKLYNSIVRGNVAMSKPDTSIESLGGGVFIQQGGELINCLVAYNMANDGYGVAAGTGGGKMINNTITANTYAPVFIKIPGGTFQMYHTDRALNYQTDVIWKHNANITLTPFYISRTQTTEGQYAVFCAAIDIPTTGTGTVTAKLNIGELGGFTNPISSGTVNARYQSLSGTQDVFQSVASTKTSDAGLDYKDGVWYPHLDTASVEYPMSTMTWYGALAYSVWLGGGLPTEAQWNFAARSEPNGQLNEALYSGAYGSKLGSSLDDDKDTAAWRILDSIAWVDARRSIDTFDNKLDASDRWTTRPHEVARKRPNAVGIYDMTGNGWEFTADCTPADGYESTDYYATSTDPIYTTGGYRTMRGGLWTATGRIFLALTFRSYIVASTVSSSPTVRPIVAF